MCINRMLLLSVTTLCISTFAIAAKEVSVPADQPYVDTGLDV